MPILLDNLIQNVEATRDLGTSEPVDQNLRTRKAIRRFAFLMAEVAR